MRFGSAFSFEKEKHIKNGVLEVMTVGGNFSTTNFNAITYSKNEGERITTTINI